MINRLVRMEFRPDAVDEFLAIFNASKHLIRGFEGCLYLELQRDVTLPNVYYTYSRWTGPVALDAYRHSELFRATWTRTKALFAAPPQAFSLESQQVVTAE